jgi:uncharacterized protein (UPF0332 family)
VTPEAESFLQKARRCLTNSTAILTIPIADVAAREAYLAAYHSAEAFIFERTGRTVKTHRGLRSEFARLTRGDVPLQAFTRFLARSYELKSIADYGVDPGVDISLTDAKDAHNTASQFLAEITERLAGYPVN